MRDSALIRSDRSDSAIRKQNSHRRYALEAEYVPVPYAELRATVRRIDHRDNARYGFDDSEKITS